MPKFHPGLAPKTVPSAVPEQSTSKGVSRQAVKAGQAPVQGLFSEDARPVPKPFSLKKQAGNNTVFQLRPLTLTYIRNGVTDSGFRIESSNFSTKRLLKLFQNPTLSKESKDDIRAVFNDRDTSDKKIVPLKTGLSLGVIAPKRKLSDEDKKGIYDLASQLLHAHPPETCAYISLGNSPVPIMQFVRHMTGNKAVILSLPVSSVDTHHAAAIEEPSKKEALFQYLDNYVAPAKLQGKTTVVITDIAAGGKALRTIWLYLQHYYTEKRININIVMQGLNEELSSTGPTKLDKEEELGIPKEIPVLPALSKEQQEVQKKLVMKLFNQNYSLKEWEHTPISEILAGKLKMGKMNSLEERYTRREMERAYLDIKNNTARTEKVVRGPLKELEPEKLSSGQVVTGTRGALFKDHGIELPDKVEKEGRIDINGSTWVVLEIEVPEKANTERLIRMHSKYTLKKVD